MYFKAHEYSECMNEREKKKLREIEKKNLIPSAVREARKVLRYFEERYTRDKRPRRALELVMLWRKDKVSFTEVRKAALAAHAAARRSKYLEATYAARACCHAAATAHSARHARGAKWYADKARKAII